MSLEGLKRAAVRADGILQRPYLLPSLVVFAVLVAVGLAIHGRFHVPDARYLLKAFQSADRPILAPSRSFLYGSPLLLWVGWLLGIHDRASLYLFGYSILALSFLACGLVLRSVPWPDRARARFIVVVFSGFTIAVLAECMVKGDALMLAAYLALFLERRRGWVAALCGAVMMLAHREQSIVLLLMHTILVARDRRRLILVGAAALGAAGAAFAPVIWIPADPDHSRIDLMLGIVRRRVGQSFAESGIARLALTFAISLAGAGTFFLAWAFRRSDSIGRWQLGAAAAIALGATLSTVDTQRIAVILGWPLLAVSAERFAHAEYEPFETWKGRGGAMSRRVLWLLSLVGFWNPL